MDGLEFSEVQYSKIEKENRYDSEYFQKVFFENDTLICKHQHFRIGNYFKVTDGEHGSVQYMDQGVKYLTAENIKHGYVDVSNVRYVSQYVNIKNARASVEAEDILISIKGTLGSIAIAEGSLVPCNMNRDVAILKPLNRNTSLNSYVAYFMMSKYGLLQSSRGGSGGVQQMITLERLRQFIVPQLGSDFYRAMSQITQDFNWLRKQSASFYTEAENCLQNQLNINVSTISSACEKSLSASFGISGRLDAEYYHPKYDALFSTLSNHKTVPLGGIRGLVSIKKSIEPGSEAYLEEGIPFIRVSDVDKYEISTPPIMLSKDIVPNIKDLYPKKDTILLSKDGSIGIAYKLEKDMEAVTSGALLHLTVKDSNVVLPDYLTLVLNSPIVQLQAERDCNGAIIQHWKPSDIEKVLIPVLDMSVQREIASKVQESFRLREESKRLLDLAVKTIEMAIETDETSALLWLELQK